MKSFFYALRQVFKVKTTNLFKIVSLTPGIAVGGVILCWSAYQNSFDKWLPNHENTGYIMVTWDVNGVKHSKSTKSQGPVAPELMATVPAVTKATRTLNVGDYEFRTDEKTLQVNTLLVDSLFFDVLQIEVLSGDPHRVFSNTRDVMVSRQTAVNFFGTTDVVGRQLLFGDNAIAYTIEGVFEDIPKNSHLEQYGIMLRGRFNDFWDGGDSYYTYFSYAQGTDLEKLSEEINTAFEPRLRNMKSEGYMTTYTAIPLISVTDYTKNTSVRYIAMALALMILIVSALNFALLEISSLVSRANEVGIHKTNGATTFEIFMLVIWETVIYTLSGFILAVGLVYGLRGEIEGMLGGLDEIFSRATLWVIVAVLMSVIVIAGVLPAVIFARIRAMEVFRRFKGNNLWWKQVLLFVQFSMSVVAVCLLTVAMLQYKKVINFDLGYDYKSLSAAYINGSSESDRQRVKTELNALPYVEGSTLTNAAVIHGWSGIGVSDRANGSLLFLAEAIGIDPDFFEVYGIRMLEGNPDLMGDSGAVVNHALLRCSNTKLNDNKLNPEGWIPMGVCADFRSDLYTSQKPMVLYKRLDNINYACITIRTTAELTSEQQREINKIFKRIFPTKDYEIKRYGDFVTETYSDLRSIRDMLLIGGVVLILILILGMVSYISTEIKARQREIAIRRTHGATTWEIIVFVARRIFVVAVSASAAGVATAYFASDIILSLFVEKIKLSWWIFAVGVLFMITLIVLSTYIQTWRIARRDYVKLIGKA